MGLLFCLCFYLCFCLSSRLSYSPSFKGRHSLSFTARHSLCCSHCYSMGRVREKSPKIFRTEMFNSVASRSCVYRYKSYPPLKKLCCKLLILNRKKKYFIIFYSKCCTVFCCKDTLSTYQERDEVNILLCGIGY